MTAAAYTPGPWKVRGEEFIEASSGNEVRVIARVYGGAHRAANARLIAAAPELLEARNALALALPLLKESRDSIVDCETCPVGDLSTLEEGVRPVVAEYDAAIAAAEYALLGVES